MSTILKALRRLEQEKSTRSDRPLGEAVAGAAPAASPRTATSRRWPMFAGIAIGVITLGAAAFAAIQWSRGGVETAPVEVAAVPAEPEAPAQRARKPAAPARASTDEPNGNRLSRQVRNRRTTEPGPARKLPPETPTPDIAVVARPQSTPASRFGARQPSAAAPSAASSGSIRAQQPGASPLTPSTGESPVIDLSQLRALQAAAKSAGKPPETIASARVVPTPPETSPPPAEPAPSAAPTPRSQPKAAPVAVAVARPAPESLPTPAPSTAKESEPTPQAEPESGSGSEAEPEPPRSFARKSPPRPSVRPPPKVYVSRTVWHPDASRRIAYVELEGRDETVALREGESIGPLTVTEIAPTGVSFDDRGRELTRRVGAR